MDISTMDVDQLLALMAGLIIIVFLIIPFLFCTLLTFIEARGDYKTSKEEGGVLGKTKVVRSCVGHGLCGKTDEESLGFTYDQLDDYLEYDSGDSELVERIGKMHRNNKHKSAPMPAFK